MSTAAAPSRRNGVDPARLFATLDAGSPAPARADEHHDLAHGGAHAGGAPPWDSRSRGTGMDSGLGWLSFQRIVDIPFEACVAALGSWQREGYDGALQIGHSRLRGPVEHDRDSGTCRVDVRLARGPLRPPLRMRLDIDCWSPSSSTALELIPCRLVRATASYFQAGHLLLDSLSHSLQLQREIQALDLPAGDKAETDRQIRLALRGFSRPTPAKYAASVGQVHRSGPRTADSARPAWRAGAGRICPAEALPAAAVRPSMRPGRGHPEMPCPSPARAGQCRSRRT